MNGILNNKKQPRRAIPNHVPMLGVLATPPSGDSSEYRFVCPNDTINTLKINKT